MHLWKMDGGIGRQTMMDCNETDAPGRADAMHELLAAYVAADAED